jgi:hypothetical protein
MKRDRSKIEKVFQKGGRGRFAIKRFTTVRKI